MYIAKNKLVVGHYVQSEMGLLTTEKVRRESLATPLRVALSALVFCPFQTLWYKGEMSRSRASPLLQDFNSTSASPSTPETHLMTGKEWVEGA